MNINVFRKIKKKKILLTKDEEISLQVCFYFGYVNRKIQSTIRIKQKIEASNVL